MARIRWAASWYVAALIFYLLGMFIPYVGLVFSYLGLALLIYTLFRMFSRNTARRHGGKRLVLEQDRQIAHRLFAGARGASKTARNTNTSAAPSATPG